MSTYEISKSSLLSLKAEILRKQQEIVKARGGNERKIKIIKKKTPLELKNKIHNKPNKDTKEAIADNEDCQELLQKSRLILEQKSELYNRLCSGNYTQEERIQNQNLLVRFDKKNGYKSDIEEECNDLPVSENEYFTSEEEDSCDPAERWVDYVDCLGRTRKCLQKDMKYLKSKDDELRKIVDAKKKPAENNSQTVIVTNSNPDISQEEKLEVVSAENVESPEPELVSSDIRREKLREQWEIEEDQLRKKEDIHYQDILFGEARSHGVGYYNFSKNEKERLKQQESLKHLREETEHKQKRAQELKLLREKQLAARIKAAKDRKRARLGLPPEEEHDTETSNKPEISEEEKEKQDEFKRQKEEKEKILEEFRKRHLRPWDVGKDGISKDHYEMTQDEWAEMKRSERIEEFAPPTLYIKSKSETNKGKKRIIPDVSHTQSSVNTKYKKQREYKSSHPKDYHDSGEESNNLYHLNVQNDTKKLKVDRGKTGVEIPPPMNLDYFASSSSKHTTMPLNNDINESIEAGLRFLKKQVEEKQNRLKNL